MKRSIIEGRTRRRLVNGPAAPWRWLAAAIVAVSVLVALGALATGAHAAAAATQSERIVNGLNSHGFPTTGALMYANGATINENNAGSWCSGTLIGCETFLTAAHCVEDDSDPNNYWVVLQHAGIRAVTSITSHPSYTPAGFPSFDIAVLKLAAPVTGIDPTELATSAPSFGTQGTIAGFGQTSGTGNDYGIKRWGKVVTSTCAAGQGLSDSELVCWQFSNPVGPPGDDSNTCNGDSGGPLFVTANGTEVVAGVTSGGSEGSCLAGDLSYDANVATFRTFVEGVLGSDSTSACGGGPAVGNADVAVTGFDGTLGGGNGSASHAFAVTGTPAELRVVLKGDDNLRADFFAKAGLGASASDFDCRSNGNATVGACILTSPVAGDWSVFVQRSSGGGEYQVTATVFGGDPPVCGNDVRERGETCDGTDAAACPGLCQSDCTCPAPVCGNDVIEPGETCDGSALGTCPVGPCAQDCTCPAPVCGNGVLESGEQCDGGADAACPGACLPANDPNACQCQSGCGDGTCDPGETAADCPADCGCAAAGACGGEAPSGCFCDPECAQFGDCCPDVCDACGIGCVPTAACGAAPAPDCRTAADGKSVLAIKNRSPDSKDRLTWKWSKGAATTVADFLAPGTNPSTTYSVCIYDASGAGQPLLATALPSTELCNGKPCWKSNRSGFNYKDRNGTFGGITKLKLKAGATGKAQVQVGGKAGGLGLPDLPLILPVTVQVVADDGSRQECWQTSFSATKRNDAEQLKAKGP